MQEDAQKDSDGAELRFVGTIPDGEYNREVEVVATNYGLEIDNYIVIPWKWILAGHARFEQNLPVPPGDSGACSTPEPEPEIK